MIQGGVGIDKGKVVAIAKDEALPEARSHHMNGFANDERTSNLDMTGFMKALTESQRPCAWGSAILR